MTFKDGAFNQRDDRSGLELTVDAQDGKLLSITLREPTTKLRTMALSGEGQNSLSVALMNDEDKSLAQAYCTANR